MSCRITVSFSLYLSKLINIWNVLRLVKHLLVGRLVGLLVGWLVGWFIGALYRVPDVHV
jgi:NhaP-type Na+/H+ or K+/H+ antiporter